MSNKKTSGREWLYRATFFLGLTGLAALCKIANADAIFDSNNADHNQGKNTTVYQNKKTDYEQILKNKKPHTIKKDILQNMPQNHVPKHAESINRRSIDDKIEDLTISKKDIANEIKNNRPIYSNSSAKKVFLYHQNLSSDDMMKESMEVCDYWMPHFYEIEQVKIGRDKKHRKDITKTVWKNRVNDKKLLDLVNDAKSRYVMPMVSAFEKTSVMNVLNNPYDYARKIHQEIKKVGADGVSIDLESIDVGYKESGKLVNFMRILREEMPGYIITIAVSPRFEGSAENGFAHHGFYDYKKLSKYSDYINIMNYDFHKRRVSPVMPAHLLEKIINYAEKNIPKEKIVLLFPGYGNLWEKNRKGNYVDVGALNSKNVDSFIESHPIKSKYYIDGELRIETNDNKLAYFQDGTTFYNRLKRTDNHNIKNFGMWKQNHASKDMFDQIRYWKNRN